MFTAVIKKFGTTYLAWIEEVPGVNTQGGSLREVKENLAEALQLVLAERKKVLRKEIGRGRVIRQPFALSS